MLRKFFFRSSLFILLVVSPSWVYAQSSYITGTITDSQTGLPLFGANVVHLSSRLGTATDVNGAYAINELPTGVSLVRISYIGYQSTEIEVNISADEVYVLNVDLVSGIDLEQLQVTVGRRQEKVLDAPASIDVILAEELTSTISPTTVTSLRNVTGLDLARTGIDRSEVVLRGFNNVFSGATKVLTDYRDAGSPSINVNLHSLMPNLSVDLDRVEVVRGPGSALYGAGVDAGVIHYITKDPFSHPGATIVVSGGEQSLLNVQGRIAGVLGKRVGVKVTGSYTSANEFALQSCDEAILNADSINECPDPHDAVLIQRENRERDTDYSKYTVAGNVDFRLDSQTTLSLNAGTGLFSGTTLSGIGTLQGDNYRYSFAQARLSRGGFFAQFFANANDAGDSYVYGGGPLSEYSAEYVVQAQYDAQLSERQSLIMGADLQLTRPDTRGTVLGRNEENDNIDEYGLYVQSATNFTNRLELTLALRGDYSNVVDQFQLSPRIGIVVKPSPSSSFRATYNRSFSSPTASSNWLDIIASRVPGTNINIRGRGAASGFTYARNPDYLNFGAPTDLVASSLLPGSEGAPTPVGMSTALIYGLIFQSLSATPDEVIAGLLAAGGINVPVSLVGRLKEALSPEVTVVQGFSPGVMGALNPSTGQIELGVTDLPNVDPLKQTTSNTYELGYRGIISKKILFGVDAYYATKKNFVGALQVRTPFVLVPTLTQDLVRDISVGIANNSGLNSTLRLLGVTSEQAAQLLVDIAGGSLPSAATPIAIVQPNENNPGIGQVPEIMLSYPNFGEIEYFGVDASLQVLVSSSLSLFGNMSWISDDFFDNTELNEEGEDKVLALNAPGFKFKFGGQFDAGKGISVNASFRHVQGFPVISGPYVGDVEAYSILDVGAGYKIHRSLRFDVSVNNVTNSNHREFIGAPRLGRLANARLTYTADWR